MAILASFNEVCSPDFAFHSPNFPRWPRGLEGAKQLILAGPSMFSESQSTLDEIVAADDKVVVRFTIRGRYIGEVKNGFPKPGELFAMGAVAIYRFLDGKIVDDWGIQVSCPTETDDPWG
jgi:predicted ester cyclase